jgi:hypothetical protein
MATGHEVGHASRRARTEERMAGASSEGTMLEATESPQSAPGSMSERPAPPEPGGSPAEAESELARLESLLAVRAKDNQAQRSELARLQGLLRDAVAHFEAEVGTGAASPVVGELERQRDLAVVRALEAEAGRAELVFRLDELLGHLSASGEGGLAGEPLDVTCARLGGTVRGLLSALAEMEEGRDVARARLLLVEHDLERAQGHVQALERALAEAREQAELELIKGRGLKAQLESSLGAQEADELRDQIETLRGRAEGAERAFEVSALSLKRVESSLQDRIIEHNQSLVNEIKKTGEVGSERDAAKREASEQRARAQSLAAALRQGRDLLDELSASVRRAAQGAGQTRSIERSEGASDAPTQPGLPPYIEAVEGLEEQVTLRDQRIVDLSSQLARERGRLSAVERVLRAGPIGPAELSQLLALLGPR